MTTRDRLDLAAAAISHPDRRTIIEALRAHPGATTGDLAARLPARSRFATMKHLST
jgi:hypothetical protein